MSSKPSVLVVEDEEDILEVLQYNLTREGYRVSVVRDGAQALRMVLREMPALILLDLMLPGMDGLEVCRRVRAHPATRAIPIIMVTAKGEESDVVLGLGIGADDYVTKPFSTRELLGRIQAVLRRGSRQQEHDPGESLTRGDLVIHLRRHQVLVQGKPVSLTATEFRILHLLAASPGRVFTRDQILSRALGEDTFVVDRNVDVHIRSIRRKLEACAAMIETVRGVGYRFRDQEE